MRRTFKQITNPCALLIDSVSDSGACSLTPNTMIFKHPMNNLISTIYWSSVSFIDDFGPKPVMCWCGVCSELMSSIITHFVLTTLVQQARIPLALLKALMFSESNKIMAFIFFFSYVIFHQFLGHENSQRQPWALWANLHLTGSDFISYHSK